MARASPALSRRLSRASAVPRRRREAVGKARGTRCAVSTRRVRRSGPVGGRATSCATGRTTVAYTSARKSVIPPLSMHFSRITDRCLFPAVSQSCHPHSSTISSTHETCPLSPSVVKTCPCGSKALDKLPVPPRRNCEDPIPTCQSKCGKELGGCGHACEAKCHTGESDDLKQPPCSQQLT